MKLLFLGILLVVAVPFSLSAATFTFTDDADWDLGLYSSTNSGPPGSDDQLQLDPNIVTPFNHIWVALSGRDGIVRINTDHEEADGVVTLADSAAGNGAVYGEYLSRPNGMQGNPSRTTVDQNGDVWVGNRNEAGYVAGVGYQGSVVKISANPVDSTSSSTGEWNGSTFDRLDWTNTGGVDSYGGTTTATDSAISQYVRTDGTNVRTMAIDADNNLWAGGYGNKIHNLIDGDTGAKLDVNDAVAGDQTSINLSPGGYGGLVDGNGVLWSSGWSTPYIARYDPATGIKTNVYAQYPSYGLGIDSEGNIWNSHYNYNSISKISSDGTLIGTYSTFGSLSRGVAVTSDDDVWVANSGSNTVTRLNNDGTWAATISVGAYPTGVSVDSNGKVWVTNYNGNSVMRIDPNTNQVDLTIELGAGANPYNYSDMTGTVVTGTTNPTGTWRYVQDGGQFGLEWDQIFWTELIPDGSGLTIQARAADSMADLDTMAYTTYSLSGDLIGLLGRYLEVKAIFTRDGADGLSPILYDLSFTSIDGNQPVPEPSTYILFGIGMLALAGTRYRRKKK
ncbi:PEP-CTERM protein-sorting domain-containing protein [Malonomonas rubra DSM 5091]|uniref:PEP-CTERM protein-sorting domain-containing protein n=1 Tax=Malonomonas rubra DSM 5091 TaxID=1122189 RepID=A0A1M6CCP0_MALRU|nr:PEP-CTERM sorting domain-containing protein [Malonomonas rubra]SHI58782.1 PEP-CTERM protein-sorting domain-containing protein [Malonomonas rubra DSM 5091]